MQPYSQRPTLHRSHAYDTPEPCRQCAEKPARRGGFCGPACRDAWTVAKAERLAERRDVDVSWLYS